MAIFRLVARFERIQTEKGCRAHILSHQTVTRSRI